MKERMAKALLLAGISLSALAAPIPVERGRVAVVYFSWSPGGNTRFAAETIAERAQAKLYEIRAATPYPAEYRACAEEAKKECREKTLRPIVPLDLPWEDYDVIFVGTPVWWGTMAPPVRTWLVQHREILKTKTLCVFQTSGAGGKQQVARDFQELMSGAKLLESGSFVGGGIQGRAGELQTFVEERLTLVPPKSSPTTEK